MGTRRRIEAGLAVLLPAFIALIVYLATLAPTVTSEDAGELITAAATLGVPHPPGFPLWVLLVHGLIRVSWAPPAWTANFASALFAAITVGAVAALGRRLGAGRVAAASGALVLAFGATFWSQAIIAEVYSLNTALLALALVCLVDWGQSRGTPEASDRGLRAAALLMGLALANHHPLTLLMGPVFAAYAIHRGGRGLWSASRLLPVIAAAAVPLAVYAYLPLAARAGPPVNWGEPVTWHRFWAHVSRASYRALELGDAVTWKDKLQFLGNFGRLWLREATPWVLIPGLALGALGLRQRRAEAGLLLGLFAMNTVVLLGILRFRYEPEHVMRVNEYYLPAYLVTALVIGVGAQTVLRWLAARRLRGVGLALVAALPLIPLVMHRSANDMSEYHLSEDFNRHVLTSLEPGAVFFPSGDYVSFPSLYLQAVEGVRPDVLIASYTGQLSPEAKAYLRELDGSVDPKDSAAVQRALIERGSAPVYFASKSDVRIPDAKLTPWGLVYRAWSPSQTPRPGPDIRDAQILRPFDAPDPMDDLGQSTIADYHRAVAEAHMAAGEVPMAVERFREAERWLTGSKEGMNNLASTLAEYGLLVEAERVYGAAIALSPTYVTPRRNLAVLLDRQGRLPEAIDAFEALVAAAPEDRAAKEHLEKLRRRAAPSEPDDEATERVRAYEAATRQTPDHAPLWNNLGTAYVEARRFSDARRAYLRALEIAPDYALAHKNVAALLRQHLRDPAAAAHHQARFEALSRAAPDAP